MNHTLKSPQRMATILRSIACGILGVAALVLPANHAAAQNSANADAAYNGWLAAYLVRTNGATYFVNDLTNRGEAFMWGQAYMITTVEDAYDKNQAADRKQLISDTLNRFEVKNSADLSWDSWNDDVAWATIALVRGYEDTSNTAFLTDAEQAWNMAYNRGWDSTYGGGIWENMGNVPNGGKGGLSNWSFIISGCKIYLATGDSTYLTKCEGIYAWARTTCYDPTTGRVYEGTGPNGIGGDDNSYNSGLLVNAANALYKTTGNSQYYNDALTAANHCMNKYSNGIMTEDHPANGSFGCEQFVRGLSLFARQNNLWTNYYTFLENNCTAAWNNRRTDYNITWNNFASPTTTGNNLAAMEAEASVVIQAVTQISPLPNGTYKIINRNSALAADVKGQKTTNGTPVQQYTYNGGANQQWTVTNLGDGEYKIIGVQSGLALDVVGAGTANGTGIDIWGYNGGLNQQWSLTATSGGYYRLTPANALTSGLDVQHSATTNSVLLEIWGYSGGNSQQWSFQAP
jgi:predicted alpha-1,6-mannanase (GH76 family)